MQIDQYIEDREDLLDETSLEELLEIEYDHFHALCDLNSEICSDRNPGIQTQIIKEESDLHSYEEFRNSWHNPGERFDLEVSSYKAVMYKNYEIREGFLRSGMVIVDFGNIRYILEKE